LDLSLEFEVLAYGLLDASCYTQGGIVTLDQEKKNKFKNGFIKRLPLAILGMILLTAGLIFDRWWWQAGFGFLFVIAIEALFLYVVLD
tara:strand:- start:4523 stop:4786 length:264 start_codon:yes stop_codon:yes gene_type:complete